MDYRFGRFELQCSNRQLLVAGAPAVIGPRAFDVLVVLVENAGALVTKETLLNSVWNGLIVEENNLQVQVSVLRKLLGPEAIATVSGQGYRFALQPQPVVLDPRPLAGFVRDAIEDGPASAGGPSVAVLPFSNISEDAANEFFADGLSEELISVLSRIRGLRVASRTSAFSLKGTSADIRSIARKLNVAHILEGSVRKDGTRVRISAQLISVASDSSLWSQTYDRELQDIFAVQDDIAQSVVQGVRPTLFGDPRTPVAGTDITGEVSRAATGRSHSADAYQHFLEGLFFQRRYCETDSAMAVESFGRAVAIDPDFALAWAALSFEHFTQAANVWAPIALGVERARAAAQRALAVGPDVAASHSALGALRMYVDWDWKGAEESLCRALDLGADGSQLVLAAKLMQNMGKLGAAESLVQQALVHDPLNSESHMTCGRQRIITGDASAAERAFRNALELSHDPSRRVRIHFSIGLACLMSGQLDDALASMDRESHETLRLLGRALVYVRQGDRGMADNMLADLTRRFSTGGAYQIAQAHAFRGEPDAAFHWLDDAAAQRDAGLASLKVDPLLANLHADSRWPGWLRKMHLAD